MRAKMIGCLVGVAVALSIVCLGAWLFLVATLFEHSVWDPIALSGIEKDMPRSASAMIVGVMFWLMPVWIVLFAGRLRHHWHNGRSGLVPALLMNASAVPILTAISVMLLVSEG
jgi:hypothetical protein